MTAASVRALFAELRAELVPIVQAITEQPPADDSCLRHALPRAAPARVRPRGDQALRLRPGARAPGQDPPPVHDQVLARRRAHHDAGQARTTSPTRCSARCTRPATRCTSRASDPRLRRHAARQRHLVGRAREPVAAVGEPGRAAAAASGSTSTRSCRRPSRSSLRRVSLDTFYRAINKVERSLIRTDADEVTYNLHVMLRFDLELDLLEGRLAVKRPARGVARALQGRPRPGAARRPRRLPAGRALVRRPHRRRVPGLHARQHPERAVLRRRRRGASRHPAARSRHGEFGTLHGWLRDNLYQHGRKFPPDELVKRATGEPMTIEPYIAYLRAKYGELYRLPRA